MKDDIPSSSQDPYGRGLVGITKVHTSYLSGALQHESDQHRPHSRRLWLLEDSDGYSQSVLMMWLTAPEQAQRLEYVRSQDIPANLFHITLFPCAAGEAVFKRPAPTPLRGHSALKFLQRCRS